jgi:chromosomal replication initiation ATPase DnaA
MRQLRLMLQRPPSWKREDFVVSACNAEAVRAVDAWPAWHGGTLALVGPPETGKTHLARAWAERAGAVELDPAHPPSRLADLNGRPVVVENAERTEPETLFHLINMAAEPGGGLLLTSRQRPTAWPSPLPDLRSRLNALPVVELGPPDDEALRGVLAKFFRDRNIRPAEDVFEFLIRRMERSVPVARALVERLDEAADAEHREVSRVLARQILDGGQESDDLFESRLAPAEGAGENGDGN